jgi:hypothetical protein
MAPLYFPPRLRERRTFAFRNPGPVRKIVIGVYGFYLKRFEQLQQLFQIVQQFRFQTGQTFIIRAGFKNPVNPKLFPSFSRFFPVRLKQNGNSIA